MRKLFTFLCAALMSVGMYATTVVTITQNDFPRSGTSFTKDGVTVSAGNIEGTLGNLKNGGSFSTTLGNFTEIEVTASNLSIYGAGWTGTSGKMTWRGNAASSVSFSGNIMGMGMGVTLKFTIEEPAPAIENSITINGTPQVGDNSISLTYYFDPANVPGICCNAPTLKVKCAADNQWDEIWLSLNNISSGTTTITLDELGSFQEGKSYDVCFAYNNGSWVDEVFQSFTPAASTPEPEPATTVVTITNNDFPGMDVSFTKDGVTVSADWIDNMNSGNLIGPGSFSTTLGNFTKIEVNAGEVLQLGEGWSGNSERQTWTGNASSVSFSGEIYGVGHGITIMFTIELASTPEPAKYYVVGNMTEWAVDENYEMNPNIYAETEEYFYALDLTTTNQFKVVKVEGENQTWYPTGMGNNYGQNGEITEDAEYTIYFRPNYDGGEDWFYNCIYVSKNEPEPADEYAEIVWTEVVAKDALAENATFTLDGTTFSATIADEGNKMEIDANTSRFGTAEDYKSYTHRLKSGGASSSTKNFITLNIPEAGKIRIAVRTAANTATDRALKLEQGGTELYNAVVQESQAIDGQDGKIYPYVIVDVATGSVRVSYTAGLNFYGFGFKAASSPTAVENTAVETKAIKRIVNGQLLIERNGKLFNVTGAQVK